MPQYRLHPDRNICYLGLNPRDKYVRNAEAFINRGYTSESFCSSFTPSYGYDIDRLLLVRYTLSAMNYIILD